MKKSAGLNATWDEKFVIQPFDPEGKIMFNAFGKNLMSDDFLGNAKDIEIKELSVGTETYYLPIRDFSDEGQLVVDITLSEPAKTI